MGSYTTPAINSPARSRPSVTLNIGHACAKFVVPSSGSTYQRYSLVPSCPPPSSATIPCEGKYDCSRSTTSFSLARSASVTRSKSPLSSNGTRRSKKLAKSAPLSRAMSTAVSRYATVLRFFRQIFNVVFENEEVRQTIASNADEALIVILDGALHLFAVEHFHAHRRAVLDQLFEILDLLEGLLRSARGFSLLCRTQSSCFFFCCCGGCGFGCRSGEILIRSSGEPL